MYLINDFDFHLRFSARLPAEYFFLYNMFILISIIADSRVYAETLGW